MAERFGRGEAAPEAERIEPIPTVRPLFVASLTVFQVRGRNETKFDGPHVMRAAS